MPVAMMQRQFENEVEVIVKYIPTEDDFKDIDILFFNRLIAGMDIKTVLQYRDKYGFKMVCDLDDHWILDRSHILYNSYKEHGTTQRIHDYIVLSDVVTVTHDRLYGEVKKLNDKCFILPNAIAKADQFQIGKLPDSNVRLFWAGGVTHKNDLELLRRPLQLIKRNGLKLIMAGYDRKNQTEWDAMARIFTTDSSYNTQVIESAPVHEYYKCYCLCDICLIPLVDNSFNIHKSNLKILEAANVGAPVIVSRVHPYLDFPEDLVNYVDAHKPWYYQINKLVKDPVLRKEQGLKLKKYCDEFFDFDKINIERKQIFDEAIEHRQTTKAPAEAARMAE